jgi:hypothetical protein
MLGRSWIRELAEGLMLYAASADMKRDQRESWTIENFGYRCRWVYWLAFD